MTSELIFQLVAVSLVAGAGAGLLAGLLGVGGGIVIVPALHIALGWLGIDPDLGIRIAVGTSLATIIFTSISSARSHNAKGAIDWKVLRFWAPAIVVGVAVGSYLGGVLSGKLMIATFATVALLVGLDMVLRRPSDERIDRELAPPVWMGLGVFSGTISSLMGIGGGTVSVPILSYVGFDIRRAVGTSSAIGLVIALPGTLGYILTGLGEAGRPPLSLGYVNLVAVAAIIPLTTTLAPVGARLAHSLPRGKLRLIFGVFLLITAARMVLDLL